MKKPSPNQIRKIVLCSLIVLLALVCAILAQYYLGRGYSVDLDLQEYVTVGLDANGAPSALLDIDAILTDLHLPNPKYVGVEREEYPEVDALCNMSLYLTYRDTPEVMRVTILADTDTLQRHGIRIKSLVFDQQVKGFVKGTTPTPAPMHTAAPSGTESPSPTVSAGYLTSLLQNGKGINLRSVCERVQLERDSLCEEIFGNNYNTDKTQVAFIVYASEEDPTEHRNLYLASYTATMQEEGAEEPIELFFRVEVYDLYRTEDGTITYGTVDVAISDSEEESRALRLTGGATAIRLYDGGVRRKDRIPFDQNGFVRFPDAPTSYRMASGVYWSPTYDLLEEDQIWSLTATDQNSLANLLRYARKEIYARYYAEFDVETERQFYEHYNSYDWYRAEDPDRTDRMTEAERSNIRLLREIQSLIEK